MPCLLVLSAAGWVSPAFAGAARERSGAERVLLISRLPFFPPAVPLQTACLHPGLAGRQAVCQAPYQGKDGVQLAGSEPWRPVQHCWWPVTEVVAGLGLFQPSLLARLQMDGACWSLGRFGWGC